MWEPELEALDRERLERLVLDRMRATLARLLVHPAHARRLGGARPEDIRRLEDWERLPFLTKETLRDAYPFGLACGQEQGYRRIHMSSGTTGHPILNPYTAADVAQWGEVMARCYVAAGVGPSDVIQVTPSLDRKSTRLNSSHGYISYAVFCLKKKNTCVTALYARNTCI